MDGLDGIVGMPRTCFVASVAESEDPATQLRPANMEAKLGRLPAQLNPTVWRLQWELPIVTLHLIVRHRRLY
jgi:hypothetical protein